MDEGTKDKWYLMLNYSETKDIIREKLQNMSRDFVAIGFYLKWIRDNELYKQDGYSSIWEFAEDNYGIKRTTASRWMAMNDKFSEGGNTPILAEEFRMFGKSQLQEMLYLEDEQLEGVTPGMTVKEIRELRTPENKLIKPDQNQTEYLNAFARHFIACKHDWLLKDFHNRVMNVDKSPVEIKNHLGANNRTWHFATDNGVAHINLFDDYVQLCGENATHIGDFDWFYLAAALQRMWNIVAMENAEKKQKTECATSHKIGTCIYRPEFDCTLSEASKLAVGDGIDCSKKCCWDCPKRMECGYRCNSAAGHPIEEEQIPGQKNVEDHPELLPDQDKTDIYINNVEDNDVIKQQENVINQSEPVTEDDENMIDAEYKEIAAENTENAEMCCQKAADLDELTFSQIAIRDYLEEEEQTLAEYEKVNSEDGGLPQNLMMRQRMLVKALRLLMKKEADQEEQEADEPEEIFLKGKEFMSCARNSLSNINLEVEHKAWKAALASAGHLTHYLGLVVDMNTDQPELPAMKNNDQRKEWLKNYKNWGLWYRDENIDVNYYKYDFSDGSRLVVAEYPLREGYWNREPEDEYFFHFLEKNRKKYASINEVYDEKFRNQTDSETYMVEFLKNLQKGEKK